MQAQLILGCHGARRYGFSLCRGVANPILDLRKLGANKEEVLAYLDDHCKLFDSLAEDRNLVNSIVHYVASNKLIVPHIETVMYDFMAIHKQCGIYAFIEPVAE